MANTRKHPIPSVEALASQLTYCPDTGAVKRIMRFGASCEPYIVGVSHHSGYLVIKAFGQMLLAHRVAWALANGEWPDLYVDHINGNKMDNRAANLRLADAFQSARNSAAHGASGLRGVYFDKSSAIWVAQAVINGKYQKLGTFETKELARDEYLRRTLPVYGEFVRLTDEEREAA